MTQIRIHAGKVVVTATLNESATAGLIRNALPIASDARRWGDEVYFETQIEAPEENAQATVPDGTVAYWPPAKALCLFFGQRPYSPVNVVGEIDGDPKALAAVQDGDAVQVEVI